MGNEPNRLVVTQLVFQYGSNCPDSQINSFARLQGDTRFVSIAETHDIDAENVSYWIK